MGTHFHHSGDFWRCVFRIISTVLLHQFGGAYWLWMLILFSFVIQAISYEYRTKKGNVYGTRFYDALLFVNGVLGPLLLGVAVGSMFFGNEFCVTKNKILDVEAATISTWGPLHGLEAIACWKNLVFGVMVLFLARTLASLYFINNIDDEKLHSHQLKQLMVNGGVFVLTFVVSAALILTSGGVDTQTVLHNGPTTNICTISSTCGGALSCCSLAWCWHFGA